MFFRWKRAARDKKFYATLYSLLDLYPGGKDALQADYPALKDMHRRLRGDDNPVQMGMLSARGILVGLVEGMSPDMRGWLLNELRSMDRARLNKHLKDLLANEQGAHVAEQTVLVVVFARSLIVAQGLLDGGEITADEHRFFDVEVFGSLEGLSEDERSMERAKLIIQEGGGVSRERADEVVADIVAEHNKDWRSPG